MVLLLHYSKSHNVNIMYLLVFDFKHNLLRTLIKLIFKCLNNGRHSKTSLQPGLKLEFVSIEPGFRTYRSISQKRLLWHIINKDSKLSIKSGLSLA